MRCALGNRTVLAEVTNLAECHEPLFDLIRELRDAGRRTARARYGARGFVAHHNTDIWRVAPPVDCARWGLWPMGGAWLSTHLFAHYAFGGDRAFLRRAYPVLKEASEFLLDFLVEDEQGRLVTNLSHSPENAFIDGIALQVDSARQHLLRRPEVAEHCRRSPPNTTCSASRRRRSPTP
jgi:alpha-L-fucosidase 2